MNEGIKKMEDMVEQERVAIEKAIKATEYKYFGDYEFSEDQRKAVDTLIAASQARLAYLASQPPVLDGREVIERIIQAIRNEQARCDELDHFLDAKECIDVIRETFAAEDAPATSEDRTMSHDARKLLPCPFCGGEAKQFTIGEEEPSNVGGDVIVCTKCSASGQVEFGRKENLVSRWNTRATLSPDPVLLGEVREAIERALQCTPVIKPKYVGLAGLTYRSVIEYDCGDPWQILRALLAKLPKLTGEEV